MREPMRSLLSLVLLAAAGCGANSITIAMVQQNNSGQDGYATLTEKGSETEVFVSIKRSNVGGSQTSHVHHGRCDNVGGIAAGVGSVKPDSKFLFISDREAAEMSDGGFIFFQAKLQVPLAQLRDGDHVLNVHDSRDLSLYVSCGEID
jgi:hypothetical protein